MTKVKEKNIRKSFKVFFDFDNTITPFDVFDDMLKRFCVDTDWLRLEKDWQDGKIGSRECLEGQLKSLKVRKKELLGYLSKIKVDNYFPKLLDLLRRHKIKAIIVSDSFQFLIKHILHHNGIKGARLFANKVRFYRSRLIPLFPHADRACSLCAHCKKTTLLTNSKDGTITVYVGDGCSDSCPAEVADIVFAKGSLLKRMRAHNNKCIEFKNLRDVYRYFTKILDRAEAENS